jgi:hypothetical protein
MLFKMLILCAIARFLGIIAVKHARSLVRELRVIYTGSTTKNVTIAPSAPIHHKNPWGSGQKRRAAALPLLD